MRRRLLSYVSALMAVIALPGLSVAQAPSPVADPAISLIATSLAATTQAESLHVTVTATGSIPNGPDGATSIDDASMEADLDIADRAFAAQATAPSLEITNLELRIVGDQAYLRLDDLMGDDTWMALEAPVMVDLLLSTIPGGRRILLGDPDQARVEKVIRRRLDRADATAAIAGDRSCAAGTCTTVRITAPLQADASDLFGLFGGLGGPAPGEPVASEDPDRTMTLDVLVDTATGRLDSVVLTQGTDEAALTITVAMSAYDEPVTIEAPPADEVSDMGFD